MRDDDDAGLLNCSSSMLSGDFYPQCHGREYQLLAPDFALCVETYFII